MPGLKKLLKSHDHFLTGFNNVNINLTKYRIQSKCKYQVFHKALLYTVLNLTHIRIFTIINNKSELKKH